MDIITGTWAANKAKKDLEASGQIGHTESSIIELVPEATYEFNQGACILSIPEKYNIGTEIITTIDGVKYSSIAKFVSGEGDDFIVVGNGVIAGLEDTGEPYVIFTTTSDEELFVEFGLYAEKENAEVTQHKISISISNGATIHTIDPKYLPPISVEDKQAIANQVLAMLPNGDEVSY